MINTDEIKKLYRTYGPMVQRRCMAILKDENEAMDAMQDVFIKVLEKQEILTAEYPSSLLYRIATNICINKLKVRKRSPEHPGEEILYQIAQIEDDSGVLDAKSFLKKIFGYHKASTREIAVLHYVDGLTLCEVAAEVKMSKSGVRKRLRMLKETVGKLKGVMEQ